MAGLLSGFSKGFTSDGGLSGAVTRSRAQDSIAKNAEVNTIRAKNEQEKLKQQKAGRDRVAAEKQLLVEVKKDADLISGNFASDQDKIEAYARTVSRITGEKQDPLQFTIEDVNLATAPSKTLSNRIALTEGKRITQEDRKAVNGINEQILRTGKDTEAGEAIMGKFDEQVKAQDEEDIARIIEIRRKGKDGERRSPEEISAFIKSKERFKNMSETKINDLVALADRMVAEEQKPSTGRVSPSVKFAEQRALGTPEGTAFAENMLDFKRENAFANPLAKDVAKEVEATRGIINTARQSSDVLSNARTLIDSKEGIFSGFGAGFKLGTARFLDAVGLQVGDQKITNTQTFQSIMGNQTLAILGSGALGAGTGISDNDRAFAERIAGGLIDLDEKSIRNIMDLNQRLNQSRIIMARRRQALAQERAAQGSFFVDEPDWGKVKNIPGIGQVWIDPKAANQTPDLNITGLGGGEVPVVNTTKQDRDAQRQSLLQRKAEIERAGELPSLDQLPQGQGVIQ